MIRAAVILFFLLFATNPAQAEMRDLPQINILAASSLTSPITELIRAYSRQNNITVTASFNSASEQAWRIEEGEAADIFITSHPIWMAELKQKGLIDVYSLTNLVKNKLVLATSTTGRVNEFTIPEGDFTKQLEYLNNRSIMVFGDPSNTALGMYTKQAIKEFDRRNKTTLWERLDSKTIKSLSGKNNVYLISHGQTAGITYYSDAYKNNEVRVLSTIPDYLFDPIIYQAAVVTGDNMEHARNFLHFIQSPEAKLVFKKHGFFID